MSDQLMVTADGRDRHGQTVWCRHFRGLQHDTCLAGVDYDTLTWPVPCIWARGHDNECCALREWPTEAEQDETKRRSDEGVRVYGERMAAGLCPVCGVTVAYEDQIGRCVYARPCGHRMYQGRATRPRPQPPAPATAPMF